MFAEQYYLANLIENVSKKDKNIIVVYKYKKESIFDKFENLEEHK